MINTDVIITGGGITGLVLSCLLEQKGIDHVVLMRREKTTDFALAETLPPSALPLLRKLNLLDLFERTAVQKTYGYHSLWGKPVVNDNNFFFHRPYQYGLKINKQAIIQELEAQQKKHVMLTGKDMLLQYETGNVGVATELDSGLTTINGKLIADATGRKRAVLNKMGIASTDHDHLIAFSCHLRYMRHPKLVHGVFIETFPEGWGIVSRLDETKNVMTLFTHINNPVQPQLKNYAHWQDVLAGTIYLKAFLSEKALTAVKGGKANSSKANVLAGKNWLAAGDAAISFDPLSSHGITNAIYTAEAAAHAIDGYLVQGHKDALTQYDKALTEIFEQYLQTKNVLYRAERRWTESVFWKAVDN